MEVLISCVLHFFHLLLLPEHWELAQTDQCYWIKRMLKQHTSAEWLSYRQNNPVLAVGLLEGRKSVFWADSPALPGPECRQCWLCSCSWWVVPSQEEVWAGAGSPSAPLLVQPRSIWSDTAKPNSGGRKAMPIFSPCGSYCKCWKQWLLIAWVILQCGHPETWLNVSKTINWQEPADVVK